MKALKKILAWIILAPLMPFMGMVLLAWGVIFGAIGLIVWAINTAWSSKSTVVK
jgi:hypothetical protein